MYKDTIKTVERENPYSWLINEVTNNYGLTFHKHLTGFKDKEYKELIKFEDILSGSYVWVYVYDGKRTAGSKRHKVELRDNKTAEILAVSEGTTTQKELYKLIKEVI